MTPLSLTLKVRLVRKQKARMKTKNLMKLRPKRRPTRRQMRRPMRRLRRRLKRVRSLRKKRRTAKNDEPQINII